MYTVPVTDILNNATIGPMSPTVLVDHDGHLYVLMGTFKVDDELLFQISHGDMAVSLVPKAKMVNAGFQQAWRFHGKTTGTYVRVGSGTLHIDKIYHNFGEVKADQEATCSFSLANIGTSSLVFDKPTTSCTCTTPQFEKNTQLTPGETKNMGVTQRTSSEASQKQTITLTVYEKGTGSTRRIELYTVASQRDSMKVVPNKLDFGTVTFGDAYHRTVSLSEAPTDRFSFQQLESPDVPVTYKIEEAKNAAGLITYRLHIAMQLAEKWKGTPDSAGVYWCKLHLFTDSHIRPKINIPFTFVLARDYTFLPSVLSLGTVPIDQPQRQSIQVLGKNGQRLGVTIDSVPEECSVEIKESTNPTELMVTTKLTKVGIWQGTIKGRAIFVA